MNPLEKRRASRFLNIPDINVDIEPDPGEVDNVFYTNSSRRRSSANVRRRSVASARSRVYVSRCLGDTRHPLS